MFTAILAIWGAALALTSFTSLTWNQILPFAIALSVAALWPLVSRLFGALPTGLGGGELADAEEGAKSGATGVGYFAGWFIRRLYLFIISPIVLAIYIFTSMVLAKPVTVYALLFYPLLVICALLCIGALYLLYISYAEKNEKAAIRVGMFLVVLCLVAIGGFYWWENIALGNNISKHLMEGDETGTFAHWEQMPLVPEGGAKYDVHFSGNSVAATTTTKKSGWWIFGKTTTVTVPMEPVPPSGLNMWVPCPSDTTKQMLLGSPYFEFLPAGSSAVNVIEITNRRDYAGRHIARHTKIVGVQLDSLAALGYGELWGSISVPDSGALVLKVAYPAGFTYQFEYTLSMQRDPGQSPAERAVKDRFGLKTTKHLGVLLYMGLGLWLLMMILEKLEGKKKKWWVKYNFTVLFALCYLGLFFIIMGVEASLSATGPIKEVLKTGRELIKQEAPGADTLINRVAALHRSVNARVDTAKFYGTGAAQVLFLGRDTLKVFPGDLIGVAFGGPDSTVVASSGSPKSGQVDFGFVITEVGNPNRHLSLLRLNKAHLTPMGVGSPKFVVRADNEGHLFAGVPAPQHLSSGTGRWLVIVKRAQ